jgi:hypothetical protein
MFLIALKVGEIVLIVGSLAAVPIRTRRTRIVASLS